MAKRLHFFQCRKKNYCKALWYGWIFFVLQSFARKIRPVSTKVFWHPYRWITSPQEFVDSGSFQSKYMNGRPLAHTKRIASFVLLFLFIFSAPDNFAQGVLLALSKADHTLAIVDPSTFNILARIPVGEDPHEVVASSDGKTAYVTIYGGGSLHEINVIDLVARKALPNIDTRPLFGPHGITFLNGKVWFSAEGSKAVGRYDPSTGKLDWSMGTGQDRTHMIYVTADGKRIYATNVASGTVSILIDTVFAPGRNAPPNARPRHDWLQTIIPTARGSEGFDVLPNGRELWTAASEDGSISVIDLVSNKLITKIDAGVQGANRVRFSLDGKMALISSLQSGELTIFDVNARKEIKRLKVGHGAAGIEIDPSGTRAFVACSPDNYVAVVDLKTLEVTKRFNVGGVPDGLAWAGK